MILGRFRDGHPRISLDLAGADGDPVGVEFIVDTGFEGELKLPEDLVRRLDADEAASQVRQLADGSYVRCPVYRATVYWDEEPRSVLVLALPGNPLVGTQILNGCHLDAELEEGGEVVIEFPG